MKAIKDRGKEELLAFKNRVARAYGQSKISREDFSTLINKVEDLLEEVKNLDEQDED